MLVHEPKRVHEFMHRSRQPLGEAITVEDDGLVPASHTQLAFALCARIYGHVVRVGVGQVEWNEFDTRSCLGDVVHCGNCLGPQVFENVKSVPICINRRKTWVKIPPEFIFNHATRPKALRVRQGRQQRIGSSNIFTTDYDITFEGGLLGDGKMFCNQELPSKVLSITGNGSS